MPKVNTRLSAIGMVTVVMGVMTVLSHPANSATGSVRSQPSAAAVEAQTGKPESHQMPTLSRQEMSPMHQEIFAALDQEKARIDELNATVDQNMPAAQFLALQQQIEETKKAAQVSVLEIQLRYAETEGRQAQVAELTEALELVRHPLSPADAVKRLESAK